MNTIGKICLALTLLFIGSTLAIVTNTYGSKGATFIITKAAPSQYVIYRNPISELDDPKQPITSGQTATQQTVVSAEGQMHDAAYNQLFDPLYLSQKSLNKAAILLFGLGIAGIASIFRKKSGMQ